MTSPATPTPGERFVLLDAMRGVAAIMVMLGHLGWQVGIEKILVAHYYLAVDFFFILSGFVIADAYERKMVQGAMTFGKFLISRLIRLYPMIIVGMSFGLLAGLYLDVRHVTALSIPVLVSQFIAGIALEPFLPQDGIGPIVFRFPLNYPIWSLFWEILANIVFGIVAIRASLRKWAWITGIFALVLIPYALLHNGLDRGPLEWSGGFVRVGFSFFCGICLWHARRLVSLRPLPALPLVAALILVMTVPKLPHVNMIYDIAASMIAFPAIIFLASYARPPRALNGVSEVLGAISYPLYALHYPFTGLVKLAYSQLGGGLALGAALVLGTSIMAVCVAYAVLLWFDEPVRKWLRQKFLVRRVARAQTAP